MAEESKHRQTRLPARATRVESEYWRPSSRQLGRPLDCLVASLCVVVQDSGLWSTFPEKVHTTARPQDRQRHLSFSFPTDYTCD
ncbi:hypothetical protein VTN00DRAFT_1006 [Thermoascus crustaceus]|uniref:uncharacterized protein n=1 Tax=Thermoascus crustaceus TaxID=5088 RepID=UPI0037434A83